MKARGYNLNKQDENISLGKSMYNIAANILVGKIQFSTSFRNMHLSNGTATFALNARLILNELNTNNKEFFFINVFYSIIFYIHSNVLLV